jgi:RND family efflux transporter MFP subunit
MQLKTKIWGLVALLAAVALGYGLWRKSSAPAAPPPVVTAAPAAFMDIKPTDVITAQTQTLVQSLPISGNLKALNTVVVKARVAGEILELNGREGDSVKAGQVVARIDPTEYQRRLRQAEQQADAAKTQIDIAKRQYDNNKALVDQGFISKTTLDTSYATLAGAEATYNAALAGADVARKTLEDAVLRAPISGQVAARLAQPGERASIDARLLDIVDLGSLELEATLSPADSVDVRVGQEAWLNMEGRSEPIKAMVKRINPNVQSNSRSVLVYLGLQNTSGLRQGMYGQGALKLRQSQAIALPLDAVRTDKPQPYVQLIEKDKVVHHIVTTGTRGQLLGQADSVVWVSVQGLPANSQVLPASVGALREGMLIRLASPAPTNTSKP